MRDVSPSPLTFGQFHLLKLMSMNGHHQVGEVAGFLGVSPPAATKNIDKLERLGLIVRTASPGDRRATLLSASPQGRAVVRQYEENKAAHLSPVLENFCPEEVEQFSSLLERFSVSLLAIEQNGRGCCLRCAAYVERDCPVSRIRGGCPYQQARGAHTGKENADETS
ncbi:MAG: MarR family transcriptional regulator [Phycisphaerae bacterium]|nr:MarR family transcriptional regulator [Phycisphaerae bacterium]